MDDESDEEEMISEVAAHYSSGRFWLDPNHGYVAIHDNELAKDDQKLRVKIPNIESTVDKALSVLLRQ